MCCFARPVQLVSDTNIFARLTSHGSQMIAYEMNYRSAELNAMILPLPVRGKASEQSIRFIDLSGYDRLFRDINRGFPDPFPQPRAPAESFGVDSAPNRQLKVHAVGSFEASFVPTINDFDRLDARFVIPAETWLQIPVYKDYSFAVFQLKEKSGKPHPMAFEFETRLPDTLFFPTVHIHDGKVHTHESFDHMLYAQHPHFDQVCGEYTYKTDSATQLTRSKRLSKDFVDVEKTKGLLNGDLLVHRRAMRGKLPNQDTWVSTRAVPQDRFGFARSSSFTLATLLTPFWWIVRRRQHFETATDR